MYQTERKYITPDIKMAELIFDNPSFLLFLEHFEVDFLVREKTIQQICIENNIRPEIFISFANMFNGFALERIDDYSRADIKSIILFLRNSHIYFQNEKYPEIRDFIEQLYLNNTIPEIKLIGKFFNEYFEEVKEHLAYEDNKVFPYFDKLLNNKNSIKNSIIFNLKNFSDDHTDIESKLKELKELLLKHIPVQNDRILRRKIFVSLFELEHYLKMHSTIEETILIPLIDKLEETSIE